MQSKKMMVGRVHQKLMDDYDKGGWLNLGLRYTYFLMNMGENALFLCRNVKIEHVDYQKSNIIYIIEIWNLINSIPI